MILKHMSKHRLQCGYRVLFSFLLSPYKLVEAEPGEDRLFHVLLSSQPLNVDLDAELWAKRSPKDMCNATKPGRTAVRPESF
jgi:hypothetical protein